MNKSQDRAIVLLFIVTFGIILTYMLFHNLGEGYLIQTDEAYHATNAYEMLEQGNWVFNTYRHSADYFNSKPPLCLDLMVLSYKTIGISGFAARFPSALGGLITFFLIISYFLYKKDLYSAAIFPALFCSCTKLFTFHMYRASEMDSIYNLFFVMAMLSLLLMNKKHDFMYLYGLSLGLAFMCKGPHAALILFIGILYIPKIKDAFLSFKRVAGSAFLAAILPLCWIAKRYMIDGTKMLNALFMGEVVGRVSEANQSASMPIVSFLSSEITITFGVIMVIGTLIAFAGKRTSIANTCYLTKEFLCGNYLLLLWTIVPLVFFSITKSFLAWYTYTSQIAMCILTAKLASWILNRVDREKLFNNIVVTATVMALSLHFMIPCITNEINTAGAGGHAVDQFTNDLKEFRNEFGKEYSGTRTYLVSAWNVDDTNDSHWEPEYVAPAEMYCNLYPVDGTVDDFLNDSDSILILDKALWDQYAPILAGHVILHDNSYLIFSNDMY